MSGVSRDLEKALGRDDRSVSVCVLLGDNEDKKSDILKDILRFLHIPRDDAFRYVRLDSDGADTETGRLADELGAISMFGGDKVVEVKATPRQAERAAKLALSLPRGDWLLLIDTGEVSDGEWMRDPVSDGRLLPIDCGNESPGDFRGFVAGLLAAAGISYDTAAIETLIGCVNEDRAGVRNEIAKLALFVGSGRQISEARVREVVADASSMLTDEVAALAFAGHSEGLTLALDRMATAGGDSVQALGAAHRLMLNLHRGKIKQWGGRMAQQSAAWSAAELRSVGKSLSAAVRQSRSDGQNGALVAERALVALARVARAKQKKK